MKIPKSFAEYFSVCYEKYKKSGLPVFKYMQGMNVVEVSADTFMENLENMSDILYKAGCSGEHIGIMGENSVEWIIVFYALLRIGAVPVLLCKELSTEEIVEHCKKTATFRVYCDEKTLEIAPKDSSISVQVFPEPTAQEEHIVPPDVDMEGLGYIMFTSGTTGGNKAVMLSRKAVITNFSYMQIPISYYGSVLSILPYHHSAALGTVMYAFARGATTCVGSQLGLLIRYLKKMRPDSVFAVPSMVEFMAQRLDNAKQGEDPLFGLRMIFSGGAKFPQRVLTTFKEHDKEIWQFYGTTEGGQVTYIKMDTDCPDTIGRLTGVAEADIIDGEIAVKGDAVMMGYYGEPELTAEVLIDGWYHTGDLCRVDEQGRYYLTGRKKNLIILSNGENISPEELEGKISCCPLVTEVLVKEKNDFLCAEIFAEGMAENPDIEKQIKDFMKTMNDNIPTYKQVRLLEFRDTPFEKTAVGKIKRI